MGSGSVIQMLPILFSLSRFHKEDSDLRVCTKEVYWGLSLGYYISYFLCCDKLPRPKLLTTEFIWAYSSRERESTVSGKAWKQMAEAGS